MTEHAEGCTGCTCTPPLDQTLPYGAAVVYVTCMFVEADTARPSQAGVHVRLVHPSDGAVAVTESEALVLLRQELGAEPIETTT